MCGPINGCSDEEAMTWREWFKTYGTGFEYVDPMKRDYRGKESENYREIVELDKRDIKGCDAAVVMYTKPSVGTSMEVLLMWTLGIPVVLIDQSDKPLSPWLRYHVTSILKTKEEALEKLENFK